MAHKDMIIDSDAKFIIDPVTREIKNDSTPETVVQHDHNSERFGFVLPRYIEGHDMMKCNRVEIHYKNIDNSSNEELSGVYEVSDMKIDEDDETRVAFSWLVSQNATQRVGALIFLVRFSCVAEDGTVEYVWNTSIFKGIFVSSGMYNSDEIVKQYADVLERWKAQLVDAANMPLVVNITTDSEGTFVTADKTYDEIYDAYNTGKSVLAYVGYSDMVSLDTSLTPVLTLIQCGAKEATFSNLKSTDENMCETIVVIAESSFSGEDTWSIETVALPSKAYVDEQISNAEEIKSLLFSYSHTKATAPKHDIKPCNFSAGDKLVFDIEEAYQCAILALGVDDTKLTLKSELTGGRHEITLPKDIKSLGLFVNDIDENPDTVQITVFGPYLRDMYVDVENCKEKVDKNTTNLENIVFSYSHSKGVSPKRDIVSCNFSAGDKLIFDIEEAYKCSILAVGTDGTNLGLKYDVAGGRHEITLPKDIKSLGLFVNDIDENPDTVKITVWGKILTDISKDIDTINSKIDGKIDNGAITYSYSKGSPKYDIIPCNFSAGDTLIFDVNGTKCNILAKGTDDSEFVLVYAENGKRYEVTLKKDIKSLGLFVHSIDENPDTIEITVWSPVLSNVINDVDYCKEKVNELGNFINYGKTLFMGDSITANNSWVPTFVKLLGITEYTNIAVSSATFRDRNSTTAYDGAPANDSGATNVLGNQVEKIIRGKDSTHSDYSKVDDYDNFDMIIISCGTNDQSYEELSTIEDQFSKDKEVVPLTEVDRTTFAGAMRYCYEKLHNLYPKAHIFFCTPIQESFGDKTYCESYESIKSKGDLIKAIGDRLSVDCIDTFKCGICDIYNTKAADGEDLRDGLHPNTNGAMKIARYNAKKVSEKRWLTN